MLTPIVLGADKTTVSVLTGHQQYHPMYMSLGNVHNEMWRAHRDTLVPLAFLAIPKRELFVNVSTHKSQVLPTVLMFTFLAVGQEQSTDEFRLFVKELYHISLAQILLPLCPGMTTPHVMKCPDGHYRPAIFELGPFIADYPEQVYLAGIMQGWCPK